MTTVVKKRLRRVEASQYLLDRHGIERKPTTLAKLACVGGGPVFEKAGRFPLYRPEWLDAWAEALLSAPRRSTSDITAA